MYDILRELKRNGMSRPLAHKTIGKQPQSFKMNCQMSYCAAKKQKLFGFPGFSDFGIKVFS